MSFPSPAGAGRGESRNVVRRDPTGRRTAPAAAPALLALCAALLPGCGAPDGADSWFVEITVESGLDFEHESGGSGGLHMPEIMGSGAAFVDYDGDGDLDIYLPTGNRALPQPRVVQEPRNRLFRQESDGRFTDVTAASGLGDGGYGMGVALGDVDNDGWVDLYLTNFGPDRLYRNRGDGTFEDVTRAAKIEVGGWSTSAAVFDYDRDGHLDIYVARYVSFDPGKECFDSAGRPDYCGPREFPAQTDVLLHNNGDGTFSDASEAATIASIARAGLGVVCEDLDDDGWPDVYVANDGYPNQLWVNQGNGVFRDEALVLGVAYNLAGEAEAGMGVVAADLDNSGTSDLFMTHLAEETNTLYRNLGGPRGFTDHTGESGLGASSVRFTGFGTSAFDVELDGDLDLYVVNGRVYRSEVLPGAEPAAPWDRYAEPNLFYLNDGSGRFELAGPEMETLCDSVEITRGLATGDIDADGDLDLLISNTEGPARLYRNDAPRAGHWLTVRALDPRLGRDAIGARVSVEAGGKRLSRAISGGSSYLSAGPARAHFGLGGAASVERIDVVWPDGLAETFEGGAVDRNVEIIRGTGAPAPR
jgi:hypothetical protein